MTNFNLDNIVFKPIVSPYIMIIGGIIMILMILINQKHMINRILIVLVLIVISQRPMIKGFEENTYNWKYDIILVVDNTASMNAVDVNGNTRINAVKNDIKKIIGDFAGARFAVINYSNVAQLKYPFTKTNSKIINIIEKLRVIDPLYAKGSSLTLPYEYMKMLLESSKSKKRKTLVFFAGDGELSASEQAKSNLLQYRSLRSLVDGGAVLGYGTVNGGKIKITENESLNYQRLVDAQGYLLNSDNGLPYTSKMNENNLKIIADNLGIKYYHMTDYSVLSNNILTLKKETIKDDEKVEKNIDIYYYFSGLLVLLLLLELFYYRRSM